MPQYTAYVRSGRAVVVSGIVYFIAGCLLCGLWMEGYPQYEDIVIALWLFVGQPVSYCLVMLTAKSKLSVTITDEKAVLHVVRGSAATVYIHSIPVHVIKGINMRNSMGAGSYILLELEYGLHIKLYGKQFVFDTNHTFYDLFLAMNKMIEQKHAMPAVSYPEEVKEDMHEKEDKSANELMIEAEKQKQSFISIITDKEQVAKAMQAQQVLSGTYYKGSQLRSVVGVGIWLVFLVLSAIPVMTDASSIMITNWPIVLMVIWVLPMSLLLNYIVLSDDYMEVRKHNLPWFKKRIYLKEIKEIGFEQSSFTTTITILYKDYRYENYHCPTLKTTQWTDLKNALEARGVQVKKGG